MNQKMGGAPTPPSLPSLLPKATLPPAPLLARPLMVVPVVRPVTVATVTRNLQAVLGPQTPPPAPTTQGFPGFVSRNFNQVSQHAPNASNANHLNGLANLFHKPAPERRQAERPPAPTRPAVVAKPAAPPPRPQVAAPVVTKKPEAAARAPLPTIKPTELPKPAVMVHHQPAASAPKPAQAAPQPKPPAQAPQPALQQAPKSTALELPRPPAPPKVKEEGDKKPPAGFSPPGKPAANKVGAAKTANPAAPATQPPSGDLKPPAEAPKVESQAPLAEAKPARELEPTKLAQETKNPERVEGPSAVAKAPAAQAPASRLAPPANLEKIAQTRPETSELKVGEVQRQQVNSQQAPISREQMALVQQNGAGLSAGGGSGQGGGGGQGRQQRRQQDGEEGVEEIGAAEALGGDDQVQWWHLRGEETLRALSSELREAMFLLRTPQRALGVDPKQVRQQKSTRSKESLEQPQVQVREQEPPQQVQSDQVHLEAADFCASCGSELNGLDPRRCPACLRQAALATLAVLEKDGRFIAYRVFLTKSCRPVASRAVYRLRDFSSLPSDAYCIQAA
ncbi:MAG: hypothetical protein KF760_20350 [Candidatus Eremiobacteraeota bacterium]|nr:hypothetical protein [Candidatus Eremiobacteraeota bacterium]MCW5872177.1 hypothetical protein [Candidatus Eremiobacteraeota bacterium]